MKRFYVDFLAVLLLSACDRSQPPPVVTSVAMECEAATQSFAVAALFATCVHEDSAWRPVTEKEGTGIIYRFDWKSAGGRPLVARTAVNPEWR
jgi:hypothetical protein